MGGRKGGREGGREGGKEEVISTVHCNAHSLAIL